MSRMLGGWDHAGMDADMRWRCHGTFGAIIDGAKDTTNAV